MRAAPQHRPSAPPIFLLAGVVAPILYVAAVVIGGVLRPRYSHVSDAIGVLTAEGAPHNLLLGGLFFAYNLLAIFAADALLPRLRATGSRALQLAGAAFLANSILSMLLLALPMDRPSAVITTIGLAHVALAGVVAVGCVMTVALVAAGATALGYRSYANYAWASCATILVAGTVAGLAAASAQPWLGLAERLSVAGYLQWMAVTCWLGATNVFPRFEER